MELSRITLEIFTKLEQRFLSPAAVARARILSIDGGGTTAIVAGDSLIRLEEQIRSISGDPDATISDFFDIVTGTGIGAVLAALICSSDDHGRPIHSAREAVELIGRRRSELFRTVRCGGVLRRARRFSGESMEKTLKSLFTRPSDGRALTLRDTCKNLLVPCFDLNSSAPFVFSRADAVESPSFDFEIWKVLRATSATPGLFKPFDLKSIDGGTAVNGVDGGLVMNNPAALALTHALHNKRDFPGVNGVEDILVISLGNGPARACGSRAGDAPARKRNGECSVSGVVGIAVDGASETVDQMLGNAFCWNRDDYVRIQAFGLGSEEEVLKERAVVSLPFGGKRLLTETNGERIDSFVRRLIASGKSTSSPNKKESPVKSTNVC